MSLYGGMLGLERSLILARIRREEAMAMQLNPEELMFWDRCVFAVLAINADCRGAYAITVADAAIAARRDRTAKSEPASTGPYRETPQGAGR